MTARYVEGDGYALVHGDNALLVPATVEPAVVDRLWAALAEPAAGGPGAVVAVVGILSEVAGSLPAVPPFVVVARDGASGSARVAVRGPGRVRISTDAGPLEVTGADVLLWAERVVDGAGQVELIAADDATGAVSWPVLGGVVRARSLLLGSVGETAPVAAVAPGPQREAAVVDAAPAAGPDSWPVPGQRAVAAPAAPVPPVPVVDDESTVLPVPDDPDADADAEAAAGSAGTDAAAPEADAPEPRRVPGPQVSEDTVLGGDHDDDYAHLFGDTVFRQVEDAAVRAEDAEDDEHAQDADAGDPRAPQPAPAPAAENPSAPEPRPASSAADADDAPIGGIPGALAARGPGSPAPGPAPAPGSTPTPGGTPAAASRAAAVQAADVEELEDHDGHTVMGSDIAALRAAAGSAEPFEAAPRPGANQVLARTCAQGHVNPPARERCRACGGELESEPHLAGRPPLGTVLITRDGITDPQGAEAIDLERDLVVGRRPRSSTSSADRMPRMVTVESPQHDISRSHVKVSLEEWHVLVEDLATTNGTMLLRPGQPPRRLHPNQQELVVEGDVVELGDGVALRFEGIW